jgi:hypothetical protein
MPPLSAVPCSMHDCTPVKIDLLKGQQPVSPKQEASQFKKYTDIPFPIIFHEFQLGMCVCVFVYASVHAHVCVCVCLCVCVCVCV